MAYQISNISEQEWGYESSYDKNQVDVLVRIRGSPYQIRELFEGSPGGYYGTPRSIAGRNNCSNCEHEYSSNYNTNSGVQLRELEGDESRDAKVRKTHKKKKKKKSCGGCCIILRLLECLCMALF